MDSADTPEELHQALPAPSSAQLFAPKKKHPGPSTWIFSDHHLQLSDLRRRPLRDQAVQQGILGHLEAQGGQLRMGFGLSGRSYGGSR